MTLFAAKKATKKTKPLKFKVGLGKVIRGVRLILHSLLFTDLSWLT